MSDKQIEQGIKNIQKYGKNTQFTSGSQAAEAGRKGGIKSGAARRKKYASRKFLKEILAWEVKTTPQLQKAVEAIGGDPDRALNNEEVGMLKLLTKYRNGDLRAIEMVHELLGEDPHTVMEEKRLKAEKEAVKAITNSDGFMQAMGDVVEEVFEDGSDTPDTLEDSE